MPNDPVSLTHQSKVVMFRGWPLSFFAIRVFWLLSNYLIIISGRFVRSEHRGRQLVQE